MHVRNIILYMKMHIAAVGNGDGEK